jgi:DNA polymerase III subunit beta
MNKPLKQESVGQDAVQFTVSRADFIKSLGHVQSVVEKRGTIPILANVKIEAHDGAIEFSATDMELAVVDKIAANVVQSGAFTVPAHMLYDIARKLPEDGDVQLTEDPASNKVQVRSGKSRFSLSTLPVDDFPTLSEGDLPHSFVLTRDECKALFEKTRIAMANDETRYYLNGIYIHATEDDGEPVLRAVSTDGHRLARMQVSLPSGAANMPGVIVPRKAVGEMLKLLEDAPNEVKLSLSDYKIRLVCGDVVLVSKLIDGTFPDYSRVIPTGNDASLEVNAAEFAKAVDRVSIISSDKARGVKLSIDATKLGLSSSSTEQNSGEESIDATFDGENFDVGFNSRYLLDVLSVVEGKKLKFHLANATAPALLSDPEDLGGLFVVMPMRV